jgi:general secretion pathway protein C
LKERPIWALLGVILTLYLGTAFLVNAKVLGAQPEQDLRLRLVGTVVTDEPSTRFAIIEVQSTGRQGAFHEGDRWGDILIRRIHPGYVIIDAGKGDIVLYLGSGGGAGHRASLPEKVHLERKEVDSTLPDYAGLMQQIRVRLRFEAGTPTGFVIYSIEPESIFARMGLKDGDIIVSINGKPFATTQPVVEFYNALKETETVSLEIRRGEKRQELHFEIE